MRSHILCYNRSQCTGSRTITGLMATMSRNYKEEKL